MDAERDTRDDGGTEERPCEETVRKWIFARQEERSQKKSNLPS